MYHDIFSISPALFIPRSAAMYHISKQSFILHLAIKKKSSIDVLTVSEILDNNDKNSISNEAADLIYHLQVALIYKGLEWRDVLTVLESRRKN